MIWKLGQKMHAFSISLKFCYHTVPTILAFSTILKLQKIKANVSLNKLPQMEIQDADQNFYYIVIFVLFVIFARECGIEFAGYYRNAKMNLKNTSEPIMSLLDSYPCQQSNHYLPPKCITHDGYNIEKAITSKRLYHQNFLINFIY